MQELKNRPQNDSELDGEREQARGRTAELVRETLSRGANEALRESALHSWITAVQHQRGMDRFHDRIPFVDALEIADEVSPRLLEERTDSIAACRQVRLLAEQDRGRVLHNFDGAPEHPLDQYLVETGGLILPEESSCEVLRIIGWTAVAFIAEDVTAASIDHLAERLIQIGSSELVFFHCLNEQLAQRQKLAAKTTRAA